MKIAIIGAMEEEVTILRDKIENKQKEEVAGVEITVGQLEGVEVILARSGIGKVNAALSTTLLLDRYQPDYVINTGSAGGFHPNLNVGDVVISTEVRHHDVDVTAFGYDYGQVPNLPPQFTANEKLVSMAELQAKKQEGIQVVKGLIVTGDSFMSDAERVEFVRSKFDDLYAAEMEAAAIAQVCHQFSVPFVIIRSLSDIAGKESNVSFKQFIDQAALNSANMVVAIVKEISH
ncbi:5'-methylthioadenosine/S-adenosylhomocysteine nucleosidase [Bacillus carboniphilus]|uniref:5'-methylthioadenosine/S-adenosylhomocysteine nucleosidase n=1 Tax=Bacillus carboniphilus TaxID=86663 RepID=A0ABY9JXA5_9BACI|nr:5'-methylthioadenosine/S-adenosylhomocysteine nucleosidase [Bacillus carboniphilus]WLR44022.1 5'-methylthioadenosine/S-adenosylhomocysteine nucleosidase [Bacillus carboniphilus]